MRRTLNLTLEMETADRLPLTALETALDPYWVSVLDYRVFFFFTQFHSSETRRPRQINHGIKETPGI